MPVSTIQISSRGKPPGQPKHAIRATLGRAGVGELLSPHLPLIGLLSNAWTSTFAQEPITPQIRTPVMSQCPPCQPILSCGDSPLSTAGNIIGIMTFAYAVLATLWIYLSRIRTADVEQRKLMDSAYANYVRWKLMVNEYEDVRRNADIGMDFQNLLQHRLDSGGDAMNRLNEGLEYDPYSGRSTRTRQKGKFVLGQSKLTELLKSADAATDDVTVLLDGITQEQMHRELKLQHVLLQQIAQKIGVSNEASAEMRALVEAAPEGAPVAALLQTTPPQEPKQE